MADLRTRFIEDYAGGLLNIARQELSSTGEVLAQDGFVDGTTLFVEDGRGVKSGLRLGSGLVECVDPTTETGIVNVRTADRTYAKIRDLKAFATAVASAQGALSDSVATSFTSLESAFESLEGDVQEYRNQTVQINDNIEVSLATVTARIGGVEGEIERVDGEMAALADRVAGLESTVTGVQVVTSELTVNGSTGLLLDTERDSFNIAGTNRYFGITEISTNVPAWVTLYTDVASRGSDIRDEGDPAPVNGGVIVDVVTGVGDLVRKFMPILVGASDERRFYVRAVNKAGSPVEVRVEIKYIPV